MIKNLTKKMRRLLATIISALLVINVVMPVEAKADIHEDAQSYGYGGLLGLQLLEGLGRGNGLSVADLPGVEQSWVYGNPSPQDPASQALDVGLLNQLIYLNLGQIDLTLVGAGGLLEFALSEAELGAIREYANARTPNEAYGAVGLVGSDGSTVDLTQGGAGPYAQIDLVSLLNLQRSELFTSELLSTASLAIGAVGSRAERHDIGAAAEALCEGMNTVDYGTLDHPGLIGQYFTITPELLASGEDNKKFCTEYRVADAKIIIDAPVVAALMDIIDDELLGLDAIIKQTLEDDGVLDTVLGTVGGLVTDTFSIVNSVLNALGLSILDELSLDVAANVPVFDILDTLKNTPISDESGLVTINLQTGQIEIDLQQIHSEDLSNLAPNTPLLAEAQFEGILDTIESLLTDPTNEYGLIKRLETTLRGNNDTKTGGLYDTEINIVLTLDALKAGLLSIGGNVTISGTVGELLNGGFDVTGTGTFALITSVSPIVTTLTGAIGPVLDTLLFNDPSIVSALVGRVANPQGDFVQKILQFLDPLLYVLQPVANVIVNRQTVEKLPQGNLFTVSALEVNVLTVSGNPETNQDEDRLIGLPLATSAVLAQHLIPLNLNVAQIGEGSSLYEGDYTYSVVCTADQWEGLTESSLVYEAEKVGSAFFHSPSLDDETVKELKLDVEGGLAEPLWVARGATCTVTADPTSLPSHEALRPTGGERTPYTYFLDTDGTNVRVSGDTPTDQPTTMSSAGVTLDEEDQVKVDTTNVPEAWKLHSFTFEVPTDATSHNVNIVHAYDIDKRNIVVTKNVDDTGEIFPDDAFAFQYSLDGGTTWLPEEHGISIHDEGNFQIDDVPVLTKNDQGVLAPTSVMVREALGDKAEGPVVSWNLKETAEATESTSLTSDYAKYPQFAMVEFPTGPHATVPTPDQHLDVSNYYAKTSVDKHIDGLFAAPGTDTTLLPIGKNTMEITYTVTPVRGVAPNEITLKDPSLYNNPLFTADKVTVSETGEIDDCTFVSNDDGTLTCTVEVTLTNPDQPFHYKADDAEVTATVTTTIGERTVVATATDKHGALRLPDFAGTLPATGSQTLVWVLGLGLLVALAALVNYVRNRRN